MALKKTSFYTLGCKLNYAETSTISRKFAESGYDRVNFEEPSDVVVFNTCLVTQLADKKRRQVIAKEISCQLESQQSKGKVVGFTPNYIKVEAKFNKQLINTSVKVKSTGMLPSNNMGIIFTNVKT